jgi:phage terminase Nu1 subunit (DNA packaging protein)
LNTRKTSDGLRIRKGFYELLAVSIARTVALLMERLPARAERARQLVPREPKPSRETV